MHESAHPHATSETAYWLSDLNLKVAIAEVYYLFRLLQNILTERALNDAQELNTCLNHIWPQKTIDVKLFGVHKFKKNEKPMSDTPYTDLKMRFLHQTSRAKQPTCTKQTYVEPHGEEPAAIKLPKGHESGNDAHRGTADHVHQTHNTPQQPTYVNSHPHYRPDAY